MTKEASDGSKARYYDLPAGAEQLGDLIAHRNMNHADGEMFCALYRKGLASHSDALRDARKVLFYAQAEVKRLEALQAPALPSDESPAAILARSLGLGHPESARLENLGGGTWGLGVKGCRLEAHELVNRLRGPLVHLSGFRRTGNGDVYIYCRIDWDALNAAIHT